MTNQMKTPQQRDVCQHTFYSIEHGNCRASSRKVVSSIMLFLKIMCAEEGEGGRVVFSGAPLPTAGL